jgi:hypothetical protein
VTVAATVKRKVKHDFTEQHFRAARFFADCAANLESEPCGTDPEGQIKKSQHCAYVVGAISSAVMGLEACINQIYLDACDRDYNKLGGLDETAIALLAEWWPHLEAIHVDTLLKYQHALLVASKTALPKGESPYQDAESLVLLRNVLTHYKPEWDDAPKQHGKVRSRLEGRFSCNALYPDAYLWFPHRCLGAGCASWAVRTTEVFVQTFCARLGIQNRP